MARSRLGEPACAEVLAGGGSVISSQLPPPAGCAEAFEEGERLSRHGGWADIGNLRVAGQYRRRGVATWLLAQAGDWLRLAQAGRLLDYAWLDGTDPAGLDYAGYRAFLPAAGFRELTRTRRGWSRTAQKA